jgi:uncharacterized protein
MFGALAGTLLFAVLCVYISFCLLFWQGQWQLVFKPSRTVTATPSSAGLKYDEVQFDATETGTLQLNGWWVPSDRTNTSNGTSTVLLMHDGSGSLSDIVPQLKTLHGLGVNVFAFDYRGFGKSADLHPSEKSTYEDAEAAWHYLIDTRHLAPSSIALEGIGLGAAIATETARRQPQAAGLILVDPVLPVLDSLQLDARTRLLPIRLLFHDRFDATATLARLQIPKLTLHSGDTRSLDQLQTFLAKYFPC